MGFMDTIKAAHALKAVKDSERNAGHKAAQKWQEHAAVEAKYVVGLVIGVYLLAALIPSAISAINGTNTSGWTASQLAIWGVLSIIILAVIIMKIAE